MKIYKRSIALILIAGMMLATSCGKTAEETAEVTTEAETTIVETTVEETTVETTEETTEQTGETDEAEETEAFERPDAIVFDISEFPFEINESTFVEASENIGGTVMYYKVDDSECLAEWFDSVSENFVTSMPEQFTENEDFEMDMNWYTDEDGDAYALLASYVLTDDAIEDIGYPDHSGAFIGVYVSGDNGMYISLTDFSNDATGIDMLDEFCDVMGIISPVAERE